MFPHLSSGFSSPHVMYAVKLAQSARATEHLGATNTLHTLVVSLLLMHFAQVFGIVMMGGCGRLWAND